jgi:hypothetical protein
MHSRTARSFVALFFALFVAVSAAAAPEDRSESREWLSRQINRIVEQLKKVLAPSPLDDIQPIPPKP